MKMKQENLTRAIYGFNSKHEPLAGKSYPQMARTVKSWGANAVFVKDEPAELIHALHREGLKCYREIGIFQGCRYWEKHPETRPVQSDGTSLEREEWYCGLSPTVDWLRQEKLEEIRKIISTTEVDGIWLDFIRYPVHWESPSPNLPKTDFSEGSLKKFSADTGIALPWEQSTAERAEMILSRHGEAWHRWRAGQITEFVRRAAEVAKKENPEILVGLFAVPWFQGERDEAIDKIAGQDFPALAEHVDVFSPMVYHRMCGEPVEWIGRCSVKMSQSTGKPVWPIIQACNVPDRLSEDEFTGSLVEAELQPSQGVIVFALNHLVKEKRLESLRRAWRQFEGTSSDR